MTTIDEARVEAHYTRQNLLSTIRDGLTAAGFDPDSPDASALSAVDEFHIGGSEASRFVGEALGAAAGLRVLDIGCGIGGPARFMASNFGCRVTGIDLTADYVAVGNQLSAMVGLGDAVNLQQASALDLPFGDGGTGDGTGFDAAYVMHVGMNIADKPRMMAEAARRVVHGGADLAQAGVYRVEGDGEEAHQIGIDQGEEGAGKEQAGAEPEGLAHEAVDDFVEIGQGQERSDGDHSARHGVAEGHRSVRQSRQSAGPQPRAVGQQTG